MTPSEKIDRHIASNTDWRGKTFAAVRKTILAADKEIVEEWKWMAVRCGSVTASSRSAISTRAR